MPPPTVSAAPSSMVEAQQHAQCPWEEPHPGQRLTHVSETAQPVWGHHAWGPNAGTIGLRRLPLASILQGGEWRDGMAAKGTSAHYLNNRPWMVRRSIRVRGKTGTPRPLKLPLNGASDSGSRSAPIMASAERLVGSSGSATTIRASTAPSSPTMTDETQDSEVDTVMAADMEAETDGGATCTDATETDDSSPSSSSTPMPYPLNDVSNLLDMSSGEAEGGVETVAIVDPDREPYYIASATSDVYGWEAELDRKLSMEARRAADVDDSQSRRSLWTGRNLLQRVLSIGRADGLAYQTR